MFALLRLGAGVFGTETTPRLGVARGVAVGFAVAVPVGFGVGAAVEAGGADEIIRCVAGGLL